MELSQPPQDGLIKDSDTANFMADVIEVSQQVPVIVDFWAPWCGPCKQLTPALENVVNAAQGAVRLVKVNVDENQQLAAQLRVQSIPAVFAFKDGQPVDGFMGALPESQLKEFVERISGDAVPQSPVEQMLEAAQAALAQGDLVNAEAAFRQVNAAEPENLVAVAGVIQCRIGAEDVEGAKVIFDALDEEAQASGELAAAKAALHLAEQAGEAGDVAELRAAVDANPDDHQARFDLSAALLGAGRNEEAGAELLEIIRRDREWNDDAAREQLLTLFEAWGHADPLTLSTRKKLSRMLFS
ncbi:MAG: thioredoxin [Alphaproteobacteria bacterium]